MEALAELCVAARGAMGRGTVTLSVAPFVPKAHTPLQWAPMAPERVLRRRIRLLESRCGRVRGLQVVAEAPKGARVQGLLSRGGREVAELLERVALGGEWRTALQTPVARRVLDRTGSPELPLPWDFVAGVPSRRHLTAEWAAFDAGALPVRCVPGNCNACGVCDPGGAG